MPSSMKRKCSVFLFSATIVCLSVGLSSPSFAKKKNNASSSTAYISTDDLLIVDCLLPGQVRSLGQQFTFVSPRRAARTSAYDCSLRGGEFVAFDRANYKTALDVWIGQAKGGNAEAQTYVGEIYEKGLGTQPNFEEAAKWFLLAAEQGNSRAELNLAYLYEQGLGVSKDTTKAMNLYRQAAGIKDGVLELTSEQTIMERRKREREMEALRQEVLRLKDELEQAERRVSSRQKDLRRASQELQEIQRLAKAPKNDNSQKYIKQINELKLEIADKESEIKRFELASNLLLEQLNTHAQAPNNLVAGGPAINIISPQMSTTRGLRAANYFSSEESYQVLGKVDPYQNLSSFSVNGVDSTDSLNGKGIFDIFIPITSDDIEVVLEAIDKDGTRSLETFHLKKEENLPISNRSISKLMRQRFKEDLGTYHALIIGSNEYTYQPNLNSAINDAKAIDEILRQQYGYKTSLLLNANRDQILRKLADYSKKLGRYDNLMIYYAGHGHLDEDSGEGYWLPTDAGQTPSDNWISNSVITDFLSEMKARHVLVVADSCYSGTLSDSVIRPIPADVSEEDLLYISRVRARTVLTSGGLQPVLDSANGKHSIFAQAFIETLQSNQTMVEGYSLYKQVSGKVKRRSSAAKLRQTPEYTALRHAGHEGSEYFFLSNAI